MRLVFIIIICSVLVHLGISSLIRFDSYIKRQNARPESERCADYKHIELQRLPAMCIKYYASSTHQQYK